MAEPPAADAATRVGARRLLARGSTGHPVDHRAARPLDGDEDELSLLLELRVRYALEAGALVLSAELVNVGDETFPYASAFIRICSRPSGRRQVGQMSRATSRGRAARGPGAPGPRSRARPQGPASYRRPIPSCLGRSSWRIPARRRWRWRTRRRGLPRASPSRGAKRASPPGWSGRPGPMPLTSASSPGRMRPTPSTARPPARCRRVLATVIA